MVSKRTLFYISAILLAAVSRLLPHFPNFSPIGALALFGGAMFSNRLMGFIAPLAAMVLSDLFLGFHETIGSVYLSFALTVFIGYGIGNETSKRTYLKVLFAPVASSILFFILTNLHMWFLFYSRDLQGLITCFTAAIPFYSNTLVSDMFYTYLLFGSYFLVGQKLPSLVKA
ncbi:MAG: hypothetical protein K1X82_09490 [Bacteroidia bacterium]|nr:hypothetical protein [Bacteroidia bacterium]